MRQDCFSQVRVNSRDVLDFFFSCFRILIHRDNSQHEVFILQVGSLYQFFEAFPVLSGVTSVNRSVNLHFLQLFSQIFTCVAFTAFSQAGVQFNTTVRRSVSRDFDCYVLVRSFVCILNKFFPFFDCVRVQLLSTQVSLLDKEHDVCVVSFFDDTLEFVCCNSCISSSCVSQFGCSDHTFSDFYIRQFNCLVLDLCVESQIQFRFLHFRFVSESRFHGYVSTFFLWDNLVVALYFFTLVSVRCSPCFTTGITKNRSYGYDCFFVEPFCRECGINSHRNFASDGLKRLRFSFDVLFS